MYKVKHVKAQEIMPVVIELIESGKSVLLTVTGSSMYPFLHIDSDRVELVQTTYPYLKVGDIVLIKDSDNQYILHRIVKKSADCFYMAGDAQQAIDGPYNPSQVIAAVKKVYRGDTVIDCSSTGWRFYSNFWILLFPIRIALIKVYGFVNRIVWH